MTALELEYYEAGIRDANEKRSIVVACRSARYAKLSRKHRTQIGMESLKCLRAYDRGVAHEINRQTRLQH